jgi:cell division protein FtsL
MLAQALLSAALLMLCGLVVVGLRVQQVHLAYQLDALRAERAGLQTLMRQLEVQVATLKAPGRVETRARQLGLVTPARQQVRLAREFVGGTTGLAAAERNRVASATTDSGIVARAPLQP